MIDPIILFCAFRYALGRKSYVISSVVDAIHKNWSQISIGEKRQFAEEILEYKIKFGNLGMQCDEREWMSIVDRYDNEQSLVSS